MMDITQM
jgi:hypothetical protein